MKRLEAENELKHIKKDEKEKVEEKNFQSLLMSKEFDFFG